MDAQARRPPPPRPPPSRQEREGGPATKLKLVGVAVPPCTAHHYRKTQICRVSRPLPRAKTRALGKDMVCRVPGNEHSANICHTAYTSVAHRRPSAKSGTRQHVTFAEC